MRSLTSPRLELFIPDADALAASAASGEALSSQLGRPVATDWPPKEWDAGAVHWLIEKSNQHPHEPFWRAWFIALRDGPIIGTCGCKGPPEDDGAVEIGYGIATSHWRQGFASEAIHEFLSWVFADPRVRLIRAHTRTGDPASGGVLRRNGFAFVMSIDDPSDGRVDRYELRQPMKKPADRPV